MLKAADNGVSPPREWHRERLRYELLQWVYERSGADCEVAVTGTQIGSALELGYEDLYREIHFLEDRGYLVYKGAGPTVCISPKGIEYLEAAARRRRSIRD